MAKSQQPTTSNDTKTIVTVLLLIFVYPIGLIVMWVWPTWPRWIKWLITTPVILFFLALILILVIVANPRRSVYWSECSARCNEEKMCVSRCMDEYKNNEGRYNTPVTPPAQ